jgi:hypothetical protein
MKFFRFASLLWTVTIFTALLLAHPAGAEDEDLPPPGMGTEEEIPFDPPAQEDLDEENLPAPSLGDEDLPPPALETQRQSVRNQVNPDGTDDDIFLPTPATQDNVNYAPLGSPVSNRNIIDADWRLGMDNRPVFSLHGGVGVFNYPSEAVAENRSGATVGASIRLLNIAQTIFLHAYGSYSWTKLGIVGPFSEVKDTVQHLGGLIEIGIGRRLSLFGSLLRRNHTLKTSEDASGQFGKIDNYANQIVNDGWKLGVGAQYDFYVIPHGSIGIRAHVEQDMGLVALTMALEPKPKKRLSLNFQDIE